MKTATTLTIAMLLLAMPLAAAASDDNTVATGHITAGTPTTYAWSATDGVNGFYIEEASSLVGETLSTDTTDNTGAGYEVTLYFWGADDEYLEGCWVAGGDAADCTVPDGTVRVEVAAAYGVDLDVTVLKA